VAKVEHDDSRRNPSHSAIVVTQHTCFAVLGVKPRWWLDYLASHPEVPRSKLNNQVCVLVADWLAHLREQSTPTTHEHEDQQWSPDVVLARHGLRRTE